MHISQNLCSLVLACSNVRLCRYFTPNTRLSQHTNRHMIWTSQMPFRPQLTLHHCCYRFWMSQLPFLPWAVRPLAEACLQGRHRSAPSAAALLDCDFFSQPVRTAAYFLAALHPGRPPVHLSWPDTTREGPVALFDAAPWLSGACFAQLHFRCASCNFDCVFSVDARVQQDSLGVHAIWSRMRCVLHDNENNN